MTKYSDGRTRLRRPALGNWSFDAEVCAHTPQKTFAEVRDDMRLSGAMRRAVRREAAPRHLVDSIRKMIRE